MADTPRDHDDDEHSEPAAPVDQRPDKQPGSAPEDGRRPDPL